VCIYIRYLLQRLWEWRDGAAPREPGQRARLDWCEPVEVEEEKPVAAVGDTEHVALRQEGGGTHLWTGDRWWIYMCLCRCRCRCIGIYLSIYLSVYLSTSLSLSIYLSLYIYLHLYLHIHLYVCLYLYRDRWKEIYKQEPVAATQSMLPCAKKAAALTYNGWDIRVNGQPIDGWCICVDVNVYVYVYMYMYMYLSIYLSIYLYIYISLSLSISIYTSTVIFISRYRDR